MKLNEFPHLAVNRLVEEEVGISNIIFHPLFHSSERNKSAEVVEVPQPYIVQLENRKQRQGIGRHYAFVYVCQTVNDVEAVKNESMNPEWCDLNGLKQKTEKHNITFPDVIDTYKGILDKIAVNK